MSRRSRRAAAQAPNSGPAFAQPATRAAVLRQKRRCTLVIFAGFLGVVAAGSLLSRQGPHPVEGVTAFCAMLLGLGTFGLIAGFVGQVMGWRLSWLLRHNEWSTWACRFGVVAGRPVLVVRHPSGVAKVMVVQSLVRWRSLPPSLGEVWLAGDPGRGVVISRPGGATVLYGRPVRLAFLRSWFLGRLPIGAGS